MGGVVVLSLNANVSSENDDDNDCEDGEDGGETATVGGGGGVERLAFFRLSVAFFVIVVETCLRGRPRVRLGKGGAVAEFAEACVTQLLGIQVLVLLAGGYTYGSFAGMAHCVLFYNL